MTISGASATLQLLHDRGDVVGPDTRAVLMVDGDDRRPAAAAQTLRRPQRDVGVTGRLARPHPELLLEALEYLLRADERTGDVRTDLDQMAADGLEMEHVVERRHRLAERRRRSQRLCRLPQRVRREVPVLLLRELERRQRRRTPVLVTSLELLHLVVERAHRSTSPITVSSEPTTAIRSATSASVMHVAVASRATNDGARNF